MAELYNPNSLPADFVKVYGGTEDSVKIFSSPARINIIGEHIDYNGGKVFPAAINRYLYVAIRKRNDTKVVYNDLKFPGRFEFDINDDFKYAKENGYANYLNGILSQMKEKGFKFDCGFEIQYRETAKMIEDPSGQWISPLFIPTMISNIAAGHIAIKHHAQGPCIDVVTACATSTNNIGEAFRAIRNGYADAIIAGGCENATIPLGIAGFANAKALSRAEDPKYASLPFNANRAGFVMGDGAGILVLEELEHAKARGAKIIAEIVGYGNTCDAYHATAPRPEGTTQAKCIELALEEAGFNKETDKMYINAHGTGTRLNDVAETKAYKLALGDYAYKAHISSIKCMTGHMFGAAGAAEAIATILALNNSLVPPTINLDTPDPECDLDYTPNTAVKTDLTIGISDSLGFGGHNACVAFRKYED